MSDDTGYCRSQPRRAGVLAAALAGIVVLAAACGGGGDSSTVAGSTAYEKALAYAQCMRSHGEPGFPDPTSKGDFIINGKKDHLNGALVQSADKACKHLLPNGGKMTAAQRQQALNQALRFSACMRAHGLPDFPDPTMRNGNISIRVGRPGGAISPGSAQFQSAQRACRKFVPGGGP